MPTEFVKKQLLSLEFAIPESYDEETNTYFIPKYSGPIYVVGRCYLIRIVDSVSNELLLSWNNTYCPNSKCLKIVVNTKLGKMIKIDGLEIDGKTNLPTGKMWMGWLNSDYLDQIALL